MTFALGMPLDRAQDWLRRLIGTLTDGGIWAVPRANTVYRFRKGDKTVVREEGPGDLSSEQVLASMGWKIEIKEKK